MQGGVTIVAGLPIPSTSPWFLAGAAAHIAFGLTCVVAGATAMLSRKGPGRHPLAGTIYFWALAGVFATAVALALARWAEDSTLFVLACVAFALAVFGRHARRRLWPGWPRWHMTGMGLSYVVLLTAFYVDNGANLPIWRSLPPVAYWLTPSLVGLPILLWALLRHPLARAQGSSRQA